MNEYLLKFKAWYEQRQMREKLLVLALGWAFMYGIFSLFLFRPLDAKKAFLEADIKEINNQIQSWQIQIDAINKIPNTPLYKEWAKHRHSLQSLQDQYKFFLQNSPIQQWEGVIKTILESQPNVRINEIKNIPESIYNAASLGTTIKMYQQQLIVDVNSDFYDTITYLQRLEKLLPNIHWDSLNYEVVQYPMAKVEMEFSLIYEKS